MIFYYITIRLFGWIIFTLDLMKKRMMSFIEHFSFRSDKWKMKLSVRLFVCLSVCPFVCLAMWLFGHLSVCPFVRLSICPFIGFFRSILYQLSLVGNHCKPSLLCRHWSQIEIVWSRMMSFLWKFERLRSFLIKWAPLKGITDNVINW
jgi:hypothetical protein